MFRDRGQIKAGSQEEDREEMEGRRMETQRNPEKQGRGRAQPGLQTQGPRSASARPPPLLCLRASITGASFVWPGPPSSLPGQAEFPAQLMREPEVAGESGLPSVAKRWVWSSPVGPLGPMPPTPGPGPPDAAAEASRVPPRAGRGEARPSVSLKEGEGAPAGSRPPAHVDDRLLGLRHVRDDPVGDDEQHGVLGAVLHLGRIPGVGRSLSGRLRACQPPSPHTHTHRVP